MIRLGFIGTSQIAREFAKAVLLLEDTFSFSVLYSRSTLTGEPFSKTYGFKKIVTNLGDLAKSKEVDAVYIASPNSLHYAQTKEMLLAKKHVICEKPITLSPQELSELITIAKNNNVILLEAMRPAFDPAMDIVKSNLSSLGTLRRVSLSFCQYSSRYQNFQKGIIANVFDPAMGGGALYDIGIYPVYCLAMILGLPKSVIKTEYLLSNGADGIGTLTACYDHAIADISYSKITNSFVPSRIEGEEGYMTINKMNDPSEIILYKNNGHKEILYTRQPINNMIFEAKAFAQMINDYDTNPSAYETYLQFSIISQQIIAMSKS